MSQDIFDSLLDRQQARLRELGWVTVLAWGTTFWQHPETLAWMKWEQALAWLDRYEQQQEDGR